MDTDVVHRVATVTRGQLRDRMKQRGELRCVVNHAYDDIAALQEMCRSDGVTNAHRDPETILQSLEINAEELFCDVPDEMLDKKPRRRPNNHISQVAAQQENDGFHRLVTDRQQQKVEREETHRKLLEERGGPKLMLSWDIKRAFGKDVSQVSARSRLEYTRTNSTQQPPAVYLMGNADDNPRRKVMKKKELERRKRLPVPDRGMRLEAAQREARVNYAPAVRRVAKDFVPSCAAEPFALQAAMPDPRIQQLKLERLRLQRQREEGLANQRPRPFR